ncbi:rod-binding protein [Roseibium sp. RKSG952]|uniref:rod-binding protein n=1 Tax=Roseibium sp. RKSG952 TaxID=2529384 RepID=UPI0012BD1E98|nr:rod-binding protein [Roseibium sp. RKSG952]MTH98273.1 hypothetical protein [Roseibium sp. RKSG952]
MAISPPSDLIMEVAHAADPMAARQAESHLLKLASAGGTSDFTFQEVFSSTTGRAGAQPMPSAPRFEAVQSPAQKFEAVILQQFVETMLPDDASAVFGEGASGEIWKSMMAEQVANQIAASGGVGIAQLLPEGLQKGAQA